MFERRGNRNAGLSCPYIATVLKLKSMKAFHDSQIKIHEIDVDAMFADSI